MDKFILLILPTFFVTLLGCANPYKKFFTETQRYEEIPPERLISPSPSEPSVVNAHGTPDQVWQEMAENGYSMLGYSSFSAGETSDGQALSHGKALKADKIVLHKQYLSTETGVIPVTVPTTQTSQTNFNGNAFNSGYGNTTFSGTAWTTHQVNQTSFIPYSNTRYQYFASYWVKTRSRLGLGFADLSPIKKSEFSTNRGVEVTAVVKGSPAFAADMLLGDVIRSINGQEINDVPHFKELLTNLKSDTVSLLVWRKTEKLKKEFKLNPLPERLPASPRKNVSEDLK